MVNLVDGKPVFPFYEVRDPAYNNAAITQNQWYDAFTGGAVVAGGGAVVNHVAIFMIRFEQQVANETIELRIIADDVDETMTQVATAGTGYQVTTHQDGSINLYFLLDSAASSGYHRFRFWAKSLQVMIRKTTAAGANITNWKILYEQFI